MSAKNNFETDKRYTHAWKFADSNITRQHILDTHLNLRSGVQEDIDPFGTASDVSNMTLGITKGAITPVIKGRKCRNKFLEKKNCI